MQLWGRLFITSLQRMQAFKIAVVFFVFAALIMRYNYAKIRNQAEAQRHVSNSGTKTLDFKRELFSFYYYNVVCVTSGACSAIDMHIY